MLGEVTSNEVCARPRNWKSREPDRQFLHRRAIADDEGWRFRAGNQQKVLISRWARIADRALILDEPTRGVDVGAKVEIYRMIRALADRGIAVLMISSEAGGGRLVWRIALL